MNNKSKGYILGVVLTIIATSLVTHKLKDNGVSLSIFDEKQEQLTWGEETPGTSEENTSRDEGNKPEENNNTTNEVQLLESEERMLNSVPIGDKIRKSFNYPEKEKIHAKVINAVDNFKTCKGEFIQEIPNNNLTKGTFIVDTENKTSVGIDDTKGRAPITLIYHDNKRKVYDDNDKSYREFDEVIPKGNHTTVRPLKLYLNPELNRKDLAYLGISNYIICADAIQMYLFSYEDWDYEETTFLEREAYKLEGTIDPSFTNMCKGQFSLIMDKETGIVLQFLSFDENGSVKYKLECTRLEINVPIEDSVYIKDSAEHVKK